jgi:PKD repeat protein
LNGDLVTFSSAVDGTQPIDFTWDFGDDITGTGATVAHTDLHAGSYLVELSATTACGDEIVSKELPIITKIIQFFLPVLHK